MSFKFSITGIQETISRLSTFEKKFRTKALRKAGNAASKVVLRAMKSNVPIAKKDYGKGGSLKRSLGRKVVVKGGLRLWYGVGPRTKYMKMVAKANRFWRDKQGRIRKAPIKWERKEQPSRRAHLSEKPTHFIERTSKSTYKLAQKAIENTLARSMSEV